MTEEEKSRFEMMQLQVRISDEGFDFHLKRANNLCLEVERMKDHARRVLEILATIKLEPVSAAQSLLFSAAEVELNRIAQVP